MSANEKINNTEHHREKSKNIGVIPSVDGEKVFLIGLIDILQAWDFSKKSERFMKVFGKCLDGDGISAVDPETYCNRFLDSVDNLLE